MRRTIPRQSGPAYNPSTDIITVTGIKLVDQVSSNPGRVTMYYDSIEMVNPLNASSTLSQSSLEDLLESLP